MTEADFEPKLSKALVFIVHGLRGSPAKVAGLRRLAEACYPNGTVCAPLLGHATLFSRQRAPSLVKDIIERIDRIYADGDYEEVIIIGHSMGAVLARRVIVEARGLPQYWDSAKTSPTVEPDLLDLGQRAWAKKVSLFVMMASISRGWSVEHAKSPTQSFQWAIGGLIGHLLPTSFRPGIFDFRRGSSFIVQTRLRWLQYCDTYKEDRPQVVQFLGTSDDIVPPNDTIDFATDQDGNKFLQIELPHSTHTSVLEVYDKPGQSKDVREKNTRRREIIQSLLTGATEGYKSDIVRREWVSDELPVTPDRSTKHLVFVVHGIRDHGYWTKKIAARIKETGAKQGTTIVTRTPSYGYFPILPFLLWWYRRQKVEWLMDHYVEAAATYPQADLHYMGHSNGTYLCARALQDYPMASFKRIMFAGSVVRPDYDWRSLVAANRVEKIFNIVATADVVVAVFPNGLRWLQSVFDLGGAGHKGFLQEGLPDVLYQMDMPSYPPKGREYVEGGHSAARTENLWQDIANFFATGRVIPADAGNPHFVSRQPIGMKILGAVSPFIVAAIATVIIGIGVFLAITFSSHFFGHPLPDWMRSWSWVKGWANQASSTHLLAFGGYIWALRFMALRF